jgi:5-methylcytosine-specific restriction endonuclease McrA
LTEPEFPYEKKQNDPFNDLIAPSPPDGSLESPDQQSSLPPMDNPTPNKFTCQICGKVFNTKEELTMHLETEHQSPKKKI